MWTVDPTRWSALAALVLVAALLALACGERSAERPDVATSEDSGSEEARSLKVLSANIYLGGKKDRPGLDSIARYVGSADVVFLQEVDKGSAEALARKSGLKYLRFAKTRVCGWASTGWPPSRVSRRERRRCTRFPKRLRVTT